MKTLRTVISVLFFATLLSVTSCSDDPVPTKHQPVQNGQIVQGKIDFSVFSRFSSALEDATYSKTEGSLYNMDGMTDGKWEDAGILVGFTSVTPSSIVVRDGKIWKPIHLFSSSFGPTAFSIAINAVNKKLRKEYYAYAARPFDVNVDECTLTIDEIVYGIIEADTDNLILSFVSNYVGGRTGSGQHLEVARYEKTAPLTFDDGKNLGFDSVVEAYDWLIQLFRDTFGDSVNRNELYAPDIILDEPYFYLSALEAERDKFVK